MELLTTVRDYVPLAIAQALTRHQVERVEEPNTVTSDVSNVNQYDRVMTTKLAIPYALGLEMLFRVREVAIGGNAIDLACGPGHFSLLAAKHLSLDHLSGCDLSETMIVKAKQNASQLGIPAEFEVSDILDMTRRFDDEIDLSMFTDAAHHFSATGVAEVLREMDRITRPSGLVFVMDLARLKSTKLTDAYCRTVGEDYCKRGLPDFYDDFENSMKAAWTTMELAAMVPEGNKRQWCQIVPAGLPTIQFILGIPSDRKNVHVRSGFPWRSNDNPVSAEMRTEWWLARQSLNWGRVLKLNT